MGGGSVSEARRTAVLFDFGGVLTTNVFQSFRAFCRAEGLAENAFVDLLRSDSEARAQLRLLETAQIGADEFASHVGPLLGVAETEGMMDRVFAGIGPEPAMVDAVRTARAAGIATGLVSNSVGSDIYDRALLDELFDATVISGDVGLHKPHRHLPAAVGVYHNVLFGFKAATEHGNGKECEYTAGARPRGTACRGGGVICGVHEGV